MPIKKRLSQKQALKKRMPKGYKAALRHDLMQALCGNGRFNTSDKNIDKAMRSVIGWKGASWIDKVFVHLMDILLEKGGYPGILTADQYTRLQDHLTNSIDKMYAADWQTWHLWLWDVYHDPRGLLDMEPGDLALPMPVTKSRPVKLSKPKKKLRKRLKKKR